MSATVSAWFNRLTRLLKPFVPFGVQSWIRTWVLKRSLPPQNQRPLVAENAGNGERAEACRQLLMDGLVGFYLPNGVDAEHGGFFELWGPNGFIQSGPKYAIFQARQLWFFSTLVCAGVETEKARRVAEHGFRFLSNQLTDHEHGGFHYRVSRAGVVEDNRKQVYAHSFCLFALAAFHRASGDADALRLAQRGFQLLECKSYDKTHGGYLESLEQDWTPGESARTKTFNTHLHVLEAFAELYRVWPDDVLRQRTNELVTILTTRIVARPHANNVDAFHEDWTMRDEPQNRRASYGHDLEAVWLVMNWLETAGLSTEPLLQWARDTCGACHAHGFDRRHGGFFAAGNLGQPADDRTKIWWVQAEAMLTMLTMYKLTGEPSYFDAFDRTFRFVQRHQAVPGGNWWSVLYEDGSRGRDAVRSGPWHAAYHSGRSLLQCEDLLRQLEE